MASESEYNPPAAVVTAQDFWRSTAGANQPDGAADTTEAISRPGSVGIGMVVDPLARLDVALGARTGTHGNTGATEYVTGPLPALSGASLPATPPAAGGVEFRHTNGTQGMGIAYNGFYAAGSNPNQSIAIQQKGAGQIDIKHEALLGGFNYLNHAGPAIGAVQGWVERWYAAGVQKVGVQNRQSALAQPGGGAGVGMEMFYAMRASNNAFVNAFAVRPSQTQPGTHSFFLDHGDRVNDSKLVLWGSGAPGSGSYMLGVKSSELVLYPGSGGNLRVRRSNDDAVNFTIGSNGNVSIDPRGVAPAGYTSGMLLFGGESGDPLLAGIRSQRTGAGLDLNALTFFVNAAARFSLRANGRIFMAPAGVPVFATDAAAGAGGVQTGELFRDALGGLHIKG